MRSEHSGAMFARHIIHTLVATRTVPSHDRIVRIALWASVGLNALGVLILVPLAFGRSSAMWTIPTPPYYAAQLAFTIALFGVVYAWLALQRTLNRPLIVVGAIGKAGFFVLNVAYAVAGQIPIAMATQSTPDLLLAAVFLWWARASLVHHDHRA